MSMKELKRRASVMFQTVDVAGVKYFARISPSIPIVCSKLGAHKQQLPALQIHATHLHP